LSREQSGRRWLLKTSAEAIVIEILLNNELRGNPEQKLSGRPWRSALCATPMALFNLAGSDCNYFALLRLFFGRVRDDDAAFRGFFLFQPAYQHAVM